MSINDYTEKIKLFLESDKGRDVLVVIIIILTGLGSFGLGRLSKESDISGLKVEYASQEANIAGLDLKNLYNQSEIIASDIQNSKSFFASSRGSKYYSLGCSGGKNIKQENRVYFASSKEAETAGYELSDSCK